MTASVVHKLDILFIYSISICVVFFQFLQRADESYQSFTSTTLFRVYLLDFNAPGTFAFIDFFYLLLFIHFILCNALRLMDKESL